MCHPSRSRLTPWNSMHSTRLWAAKTTRLHRTRRGSHAAEHRAVGGRGRARPRYASRGGGWCAARPHLLQRWVFRLSSVSIWAASHAHSDTPQQRNVACGRRECGSPSRRGSACTQVTLRLALWRGGTAGGHPGCMVRHPAPVVEPALPAVSATPHSLCTATIIDTPSKFWVLTSSPSRNMIGGRPGSHLAAMVEARRTHR